MEPRTFQYVECDIPEGVSIRQWRQDREPPPPRRRRLRALLQRAARLVR